MKQLIVTITLMAVLAPAAQGSLLFTFEEVAATTYVDGIPVLACDQGGLQMIIYRTGSALFNIKDLDASAVAFPDGWGSRALSPWPATDVADWYVFVFSAPLSSVQMEFTDTGFDLDTIEMVAYDGVGGSGVEVASNSLYFGSASAPTYGVLSVDTVSDEIWSVMVRAGTAEYPNSMYIDNIQVTAMPEPTTMGLLGFSLAGFFVGRMWRRRRQA